MVFFNSILFFIFMIFLSQRGGLILSFLLCLRCGWLKLVSSAKPSCKLQLRPRIWFFYPENFYFKRYGYRIYVDILTEEIFCQLKWLTLIIIFFESFTQQKGRRCGKWGKGLLLVYPAERRVSLY